MSDREEASPRGRSRSRSRESDRSSNRSGARNARRYSRSRSRSYRTRSRSPSPRYSRSRSRSPSPRYSRRSRSKSNDRSYRRSYRGRSRSNSPYGGRRYRRSRSPMSSRKRHRGNRENPHESRCVGVFGLSIYTQERDLREVFSRYGPIDDIQVVYDHQTGRSRGFAFIYFKNVDDASEAKERAPGVEIDGHKVRCDFSITERAHTPTPGIYLGKPTSRGYRGEGRSRRRSPSPYYGRRYSRSRSRSYSPRTKKEITVTKNET